MGEDGYKYRNTEFKYAVWHDCDVTLTNGKKATRCMHWMPLPVKKDISKAKDFVQKGELLFNRPAPTKQTQTPAPTTQGPTPAQKGQGVTGIHNKATYLNPFRVDIPKKKQASVGSSGAEEQAAK